jgi:thymidylate synthase
MIATATGSVFVGAADRFFSMRTDMIEALLSADVVHPAKWQQLDVTESPAHATHELLNTTLWYDMPATTEDAQLWMEPDLPWAESHFRERVLGLPLNPGVEHRNWPYHANGQALHLKPVYDYSTGMMNQGYDHNYMERFWAKKLYSLQGYRFSVGDLGSVVTQLRDDPSTRQAFLPVWFPEDTGAQEGQRVPCTLGYHFIIRENRLHIVYYLRSCEIYRHFTNDAYMAVRLAQWMKDQIAIRGLQLGQLTMQITSLHAFVGDVEKIKDML